MTSSYTTKAKAAVSSRVHAKAAPFKAKPTIVDDEPVTQAQAQQSIFEAFNLPSGKRVLVAFISGLFTGACTAYSGISLTAYLAVGCAVLTGSAFLVFITSFIGYVLALVACVTAAGKMQTFILSGDIDRCYQKCSNTVLNVFGSARNKFNFWSAA